MQKIYQINTQCFYAYNLYNLYNYIYLKSISVIIRYKKINKLYYILILIFNLKTLKYLILNRPDLSALNL